MIDDGGTLRLIGAIVQQHPTFAARVGSDGVRSLFRDHALNSSKEPRIFAGIRAWPCLLRT
jgi:hypothetical protein